MVSTRHRRIVVQIGAVLAVFILQVGTVYLNSNLRIQLARTMASSSTILSLALLVVLAGIASGIILAFFLCIRKKNHLEADRPVLKAVLFGVLPTLGVVVRLGFWSGMPLTFPEYLLEVRQWAVNSEMPSLWLGLVIGWALRQFLPFEEE